jgi:hypothetical protein
MEWFWPNADQLNDYPDPVGFDAEWTDWVADLADGPPVVAEIFAREYIQNSVDAIRTQKELIAELGIALGSKKLGINFRFIELKGKHLERFAKESGLGDLRDRYRKMSEDEKVTARLNMSDWLDSPAQPETLRLLVCEEIGGVGMFGHWWTQGDVNKDDSRLKLALIQTQSEKGSKVSGGSWGHGKKAIANASKCRALFAYTCFIERSKASENDAGVTRRLTGVAYWKKHVDRNLNVRCQGLGIFGSLRNPGSNEWADNFMPLDDKSADDCISQFGVADIAVRSSKQAEQCGTTYVIVEPAFTPKDLVQSIERNWWPLICKDEISISVTDTKGDNVEIAPQSQTPLAPFLQAYELLNSSKAPGEYELVKDVEVSHGSKNKLASGTIALTSDTGLNGWSYSEQEDAASLVCLVRGDMVIAYQPSPPKRWQLPFVRGVFVVDSETNKESAQILRLAEPHLHNSWQTQDQNIVSPEDRKYADEIMRQIHRHVKDLRTIIKGVRRPVNTQFRAFSNIFKSGKAGIAKKPKPKQNRLFSIQYPNGTKRVSGSSVDTLALSTECLVSLRDTPKNPAPNQLRIQVKLWWSVQEEGLKNDPGLLDTARDVVPKGFSSVGAGIYEGVINRDEGLTFKWHSQEFSIDWSVAPTPIVDKAV